MIQELIQELTRKILNYLHNSGENDDRALNERPRSDIGKILCQQVEVPRLESSAQLLELAHDLNPLVHVAQRLGEVLHRHVHVLQLLRKVLPFVVAESGQVKVDQLGAKLGELIVQTHGVVAGLRGVLLVLGGGLPGVRMNYLALGVTNCEANCTVTA